MNLSSIYWYVDKNNQRAIKFYDKNGYQRISPEIIGGGTNKAYIWYQKTKQQICWWLPPIQNARRLLTMDKEKTCIIGENVKIGENVTFGHNVIIEDDVTIGDNSQNLYQ